MNDFTTKCPKSEHPTMPEAHRWQYHPWHQSDTLMGYYECADCEQRVEDPDRSGEIQQHL